MKFIGKLITRGGLLAGLGAAAYYLMDDATKKRAKRIAADGLRVVGETAHVVADILDEDLATQQSASAATAAQWEKAGL